MTSTTWDNSSHGTESGDPFEGLPPAPEQPQQGPPEARDFSPASAAPAAPTHNGHSNGGGQDSQLAMLRERIATAEAEAEAEPLEWVREIPKIGIRLVCNPEIENTTFRTWMRAAQPKAKRRSGQPADPNDNDQLVMADQALTNTNVRIEMDHAFGTGRDADWRPLRSEVDGELLTLRSDELKRLYNVMTSLAVLKKLYHPKADPRIIDAGMALLDEAGFAGGLDDDPEG